MMSKAIALRMAEQHKTVRAKSAERMKRKHESDIVWNSHKDRLEYHDGTPVGRDDPRYIYQGGQWRSGDLLPMRRRDGSHWLVGY